MVFLITWSSVVISQMCSNRTAVRSLAVDRPQLGVVFNQAGNVVEAPPGNPQQSLDVAPQQAVSPYPQPILGICFASLRGRLRRTWDSHSSEEKKIFIRARNAPKVHSLGLKRRVMFEESDSQW